MEASRDELQPRLRAYLEFLLERNRVTNLTAVREWDAAWDRLILGSLVVLDAHAFTGDERVADVGSGGGLPGIPMKLALPGLRLTLVESDQKKAAFLRDVVAELGLDGVSIEARRAEDLGREVGHREAYDVVVTRAAAPAPVAAEFCLPLVRPGGVLLAVARELDWRNATRAVGQLGGRLTTFGHDTVTVLKVSPTPPTFPRRVGVPAKRPL